MKLREVFDKASKQDKERLQQLVEALKGSKKNAQAIYKEINSIVKKYEAK